MRLDIKIPINPGIIGHHKTVIFTAVISTNKSPVSPFPDGNDLSLFTFTTGDGEELNFYYVFIQGGVQMLGRNKYFFTGSFIGHKSETFSGELNFSDHFLQGGGKSISSGFQPGDLTFPGQQLQGIPKSVIIIFVHMEGLGNFPRFKAFSPAFL